MIRFGKSTLFRFKLSLIRRLLFHILGQDFVGASIRFFHFKRTLGKIEFNNCLDAGCGTGDFSFYIAEKFHDVIIDAVDIVSSTLKENEEIKKIMNIKNITYFEKNLLKLGVKDRYDFIYLIGTLIYFAHKENITILKNLKNAVKTGGFFYLDVPQKNFDGINIIPIRYYKKMHREMMEENRGHLYSIEGLNSILQSLGFKIVDSHYTFGYMGRLAWEIDAVLKEHNLNKTKIVLLPMLKLLAFADSRIKNKKGCHISILCQKLHIGITNIRQHKGV